MQPTAPRNADSVWLWLLAALLAAAGLGVASIEVQQAGIAPAALFPIVLGLLLGLAMLGLAAVVSAPRPRRLSWLVVLVGLVTVATQHAWAYRQHRVAWQHERNTQPMVTLFRPDDSPPSWWQFVQREATPGQVVWWGVDALLVVAGAVILVTPARWPAVTTSSPPGDQSSSTSRKSVPVRSN